MPETTSGNPVTITTPTDEQILITREFDAPKHLVYKAWTTPELVRRWWAGRRGTVDSVEIDLRVGGRWRYVLTANGGFQVAFHGEYREIVPNERIVTTEVYESPEAAGHEAPLNIITFEETDGRTTLRLLTQTSTKELRDLILRSGMEVGVREQMEILDELTRSLAA
ncbi:uncharacterized protein YndB with AHSA1/START domain [Herbihabitans rhizosphaerae]|uniref:Uncharacterized protein YndB with AHSA1/START domain n=1 Tax=Herbihabitans rhizosphaerae TaxID=1872711 RepID=A0A4Q7KVG8_9PSEU|nr:SRPBCC family protein [Herbihabitans rhizosphaerae]RZS41028.1 uncharacterized protein YndB with AHSA1/START domain [Herbihabitans rhizosphaerae]